MTKLIQRRNRLLNRVLPVLLLVWLVEGCYTTVVRVETTPPGAEVHYDFEPKGVTPTEFEVDWYGKHKLTLDHPDQGRRIEAVDLKAPAYLWFPFDFFAAILPIKFTDQQTFTFDLTETSANETEVNNDDSTQETETISGGR